MRILGIDCGTERTGFGLIESDGSAHRMLGAGCIVTSPKEPLELRLLKIAQGLRELIQTHIPSDAAVEEVFYSQNVKTALKLSHVRGVALLTIAEAGLALGEYSALEIKSSVVGYGRAEKSQVKMMVHSLLNIAEPVESEDACDAMAVAICHATHAASQRRLGLSPNLRIGAAR
ncbi:MAG TPA: crossover junction endodeoxyribonuclease RuvC [Bryobacteraceae bacterium]|nr:crossover junction endodeoxyribonuclease RuvC [Bryobacteraceae bacterium]